MIQEITVQIYYNMPYINYVALEGWSSLDNRQHTVGYPTPIKIPLSNDALTAILAQNNSVLDKFVKNKVWPAFIGRSSSVCICIACQSRPAIRMVNTISLHSESPDGPTIVDHTPFPVCDSNDCSHRASRRAHQYRMDTTAAVPEFADTEMEMCNNCKITKHVSIDGRMKRCSRCKAKLYCSKECQRQDWKNGHKNYCKSVDG